MNVTLEADTVSLQKKTIKTLRLKLWRISSDTRLHCETMRYHNGCPKNPCGSWFFEHVFHCDQYMQAAVSVCRLIIILAMWLYTFEVQCTVQKIHVQLSRHRKWFWTKPSIICDFSVSICICSFQRFKRPQFKSWKIALAISIAPVIFWSFIFSWVLLSSRQTLKADLRQELVGFAITQQITF